MDTRLNHFIKAALSVLSNAQNLCFRAAISKNVTPATQFHNIKAEFKGYMLYVCVSMVCNHIQHMSHVMRKPTFWFSNWSDTNQAVQLQKMARGLKFRI